MNMLTKVSQGKVEPSCEIVVPSKILRRTSTAELLSIGTSISSITVMITTIANMTK